jgi:4-amino-4-deoxy-L-arabinose transferase-like glycosyltransferase
MANVCGDKPSSRSDAGSLDTRGVDGEGFARVLAVVENRRHLLLACLVAIIVVGGGLYSVFLGPQLRYADELEYYTLATNLVEKHAFTMDGLHPSAFRPPGYPLFLALPIALGAGVVPLRTANFLALGGCVLLTYAIVKQQWGALAGLIGASLVVGYPVLFYTAGTLYPQTLGSLWLLLALHVLLDRRPAFPSRYLLAGLFFGALLLFIPSFVFTLVITVLWALFMDRRVRPAGVLAMCLVPALMVGTWSIRNYYHFGEFVYGSANSGINLLLGNSENARPNSGTQVDIAKYQGASGDDVQIDRYYRAQAINYVLSHKERAARLYALKVVNFFNYRNDLATKTEMSGPRDLVMLLTYGPLLLLCLLRLAQVGRRPLSPFEWLMLLLYVSNAFYAAVFFTRVRLRLPLDFLVIMLVAGFLSQWVRGRSGVSADVGAGRRGEASSG